MTNDFYSHQTSPQQASVANTIKTLNTNFMVYLICLVAGLSLMVMGGGVMALGVQIAKDGRNADGILLLGTAFMMIGMVVLIVSLIFWCILHYHLWKVIPRDIARTTPGKAVGLLFIPLFNLYWVFVSCLGLSKDINKTLQQRGMQYRVSEGLELTLCILSVLSNFCVNPSPDFSPVDLAGMAVCLAACVVSMIFYKSVKDGAIALLEQRQ